jgi:hypothetical protein
MSLEARAAFLQGAPIDVHNIVDDQQMIRQQVQQGLAALLENVEIKAEMGSSYTLQNVDDRLAKLRFQLLEIGNALRPAQQTRTIEEEIDYLTKLRARDFGATP